LDGEPTRFCVTPIGAAGTRETTTIEGLRGRKVDALKAAWLEGELVHAATAGAGSWWRSARRSVNGRGARRTDADIDAATAGSLCRCCTYARIRAAIHRAAAKLAT
jgi:isoquinoline 1-oxidoreductase alpha subunit